MSAKQLLLICSIFTLLLPLSACEDDDENKGPTAVITQPSEAICIPAGGSVSFTGESAANFDGPYEYQWTFDGVATTSSDQNPAAVTFPDTGTFTIVFTVWDKDLKKDTASVTVTVKLNCDPVVASIDSPANLATFDVGTTVPFQGSVTGGDPPYQWDWEFAPGGVRSNLQNPSMTYTQEGTFDASLIVLDSFGDEGVAGINVIIEAGAFGGHLDTPVTAPDAVILVDDSFLDQVVNQPSIMVFGSNGMALYNYFLLEFIYTFIDAATYLGGVGMTWTGVPRSSGGAAESAHALFGFNGTGSWITYWDPVGGGFGITRIFSGGGTDAIAYNNDPTSAGFVYTRPGTVILWEIDPSTLLYAGVASYTTTRFPGFVGDLISAFGRGPAQSFVAITTGDAGSPGQLYLHDGVPFTNGTLIGDVGMGPRKIRCLGNICVVSNFDSESITVATWDQDDNVTIVGDIQVGSGPVGIDLLDLGNGDTAIVSTGFNDNTYTVTVVGPSGAEVSSMTAGVPTECTSPAHAIWLPNDSRKIAFTCFTSDKFVVIDSGL